MGVWLHFPRNADTHNSKILAQVAGTTVNRSKSASNAGWDRNFVWKMFAHRTPKQTLLMIGRIATQSYYRQGIASNGAKSEVEVYCNPHEFKLKNFHQVTSDRLAVCGGIERWKQLPTDGYYSSSVSIDPPQNS